MSESGEKIRRRTGERGRGGNTLTPYPTPSLFFPDPHLLALCHQSEQLEQTISFLHASKTHWCTILRRVSVECIFYTVSEYASFGTI